ncbi:YdcH family protein [Aquabacterium sp.]|uniref:YdcH family protein n=1 Tax=Aquabacterium sp. TaxID=1872578 RepID=UPI0035B48832
MDLDNHPLARDFPEFKDKIHELKTGNTHFARLHREYEEVDKAVVRLETGVEHGSDAELEQKKKLRVVLKDELYGMLKA